MSDRRKEYQANAQIRLLVTVTTDGDAPNATKIANRLFHAIVVAGGDDLSAEVLDAECFPFDAVEGA
jgi:hypothetical protein